MWWLNSAVRVLIIFRLNFLGSLNFDGYWSIFIYFKFKRLQINFIKSPKIVIFDQNLKMIIRIFFCCCCCLAGLTWPVCLIEQLNKHFNFQLFFYAFRWGFPSLSGSLILVLKRKKSSKKLNTTQEISSCLLTSTDYRISVYRAY